MLAFFNMLRKMTSDVFDDELFNRHTTGVLPAMIPRRAISWFHKRPTQRDVQSSFVCEVDGQLWLLLTT